MIRLLNLKFGSHCLIEKEKKFYLEMVWLLKTKFETLVKPCSVQFNYIRKRYIKRF